MQELLQLGDEVSFEIKHISNKDKKINAINVSKLPKGTIAALQSAERGRYKGTVKTLPGESSWRSQAPYSEHAAACLSFVKPGLCCNWTPSIGFISKGARHGLKPAVAVFINLLAACHLVLTDK